MPIPNPSLLLDTHAWIWAVAGDPRAEQLKGYNGRCAISAISVWEVGMLVSRGRLELEPDLETWVESNLKEPMGLQPLTPDIALRSSGLDNFHGDPADRILVATALQTCQPLVTADRKIISWFQANPDQRHLCLALA
jgi:PIN domain nuclease of toxin-antitoxin system